MLSNERRDLCWLQACTEELFIHIHAHCDLIYDVGVSLSAVDILGIVACEEEVITKIVKTEYTRRRLEFVTQKYFFITVPGYVKNILMEKKFLRKIIQQIP